MKLPKLYRPVLIAFWSLRAGLGANLGVIFDMDELVTRKAMRVAVPEGWKWQICNWRVISEWDWSVTADQEVLDNNMYEDQYGGIESWK